MQQPSLVFSNQGTYVYLHVHVHVPTCTYMYMYSVFTAQHVYMYMYMYRYCVVLPAGILLACLLSFKLLCVQVALMIVFGGQFS